MSKVTINGVVISSTPDYNTCPLCGHPSDHRGLCRTCRTSADMTPRRGSVVSAKPSWDTHRLVDGNWVLKGTAVSHQPTPAPKAPIGFIPPATPVLPSAPTPVSYLGSRKEYLRAIEVAAGKVLLAGSDSEAIDMLRRGRMGGRKDNMGDLHGLLMRYTTGRYS